MIIVSPAKINLYLHVTGKREDGFHELSSLMVPIDLCDTLDLRFKGNRIRVDCDHPDVPEDSSNLVYRAAALFRDRFIDKRGCSPFEGIQVKISKTIPVGGGLGGGSSNAAVTLMALNRHGNMVFSTPELMEMGQQLGADVPFFMMEGPAHAAGVGEVLEPCPTLPEFFIVLVNPGLFASTADVFKKLEFGLTFKPDYIMNTGSNVLPKGQGPDSWECLQNDLEGPAITLYPEIGSIKEEMELLLQQKVFMSGSGSSLFALFTGHDKAEHAYDLLRKKWSEGEKQVFLSRVWQGKK